MASTDILDRSHWSWNLVNCSLHERLPVPLTEWSWLRGTLVVRKDLTFPTRTANFGLSMSTRDHQEETTPDSNLPSLGTGLKRGGGGWGWCLGSHVSCLTTKARRSAGSRRGARTPGYPIKCSDRRRKVDGWWMVLDWSQVPETCHLFPLGLVS